MPQRAQNDALLHEMDTLRGMQAHPPPTVDTLGLDTEYGLSGQSGAQEGAEVIPRTDLTKVSLKMKPLFSKQMSG